MEQALCMARLALQHQEVPVGCVVEHKGTIVAKGCNEVNVTLNASRHAEMVAIDQLVQVASSRKLPLSELCKQCTLYVTVEPCIMCTCALRWIGIETVVFGCHNERFGGCGSVLDVHTCTFSLPSDTMCQELKLKSGVLQDKAVEILQQFYKTGNPKLS